MKTFADFGIDLRGKGGEEVKVPCPECSPHRKKSSYPCLSVNTEKGVWHCWHCDWSGTLKQGIEQRSEPSRWKVKTYRKPAYHPPLMLDSAALEFLRKRGITDEVIERAKLDASRVYFPQTEGEHLAVMFPYFRNGECVNFKYRAVAEKYFRLHGGAERVLYGFDDMGDSVVVVEGEMDKLACAVAGHWSCVSVPDGAPSPTTKDYSSKFDFLDGAKDRLDRVKRFVIAVDSDAPGQKLEEELARRLGRERCFRVVWPEGCKDANDVLLKLGADALRSLLDTAQPYPLAGIFELTDLSDRVVNIHQHGMPKAEATGWRSMDGKYGVRAGEWTVVTGIPGHGKSEWLDALMINLCRNSGWRFAVYSPENQPLELHVSKLAEKLIGKPFNRGPSERINEDELRKATDWLNEKVTFILPEEPTLDCLLSLAKALVFRKGIRGLILDPWNEIEHSRPDNLSETEYVSQSLSRIRSFARQNGVHVFVVCHPTKLAKDKDGSYPVPTPYDISGSAHWRNKADNAIAVWRDFEPGRRVTEIHIQKVRFKDIGQAGQKVDLIYHLPTGRYFDDDGNAPRETVYGIR